MTRLKATGNKYGAVRAYSELCGRWFSSKAEAQRGQELKLMEKAGEIYGLEYQPRWILSIKPTITYTADFQYVNKVMNQIIVEDVKGVLTRDTRTKIAWVKEKYGIKVKLIGKGYQHEF